MEVKHIKKFGCPKLGPKFCHFLKVASLVFLDIAQSCSLEQCLTSSRTETSKEKKCGTNWLHSDSNVVECPLKLDSLVLKFVSLFPHCLLPSCKISLQWLRFIIFSCVSSTFKMRFSCCRIKFKSFSFFSKFCQQSYRITSRCYLCFFKDILSFLRRNTFKLCSLGFLFFLSSFDLLLKSCFCHSKELIVVFVIKIGLKCKKTKEIMLFQYLFDLIRGVSRVFQLSVYRFVCPN